MHFLKKYFRFMNENKLNVVYMGTPEFAVAPLQAILEKGHQVSAVVTVPDKPAGRGRKLRSSAVKEFAAEHGLKVLQPEKLRDESFITELTNLSADVFVVVAFRMLPAAVWQIPKLGTFNLHASLLPQYRGAAPINWAVINGEKKSGVTTFLIDDKIDTGSILMQKEIALSRDETAGSLHDKLMIIGAELVVETLNGLANKTIQPKVQETGELKPAPKIFKEDCKIDWNLPGDKIESFIRGLSPYPAAYTEIKSAEVNGQFKITQAKFIAENSNADFPQMKIEGKELFVQLKDGKLQLGQIQPQGKRSMSAKDFVNGIQDKNQVFTIG